MRRLIVGPLAVMSLVSGCANNVATREVPPAGPGEIVVLHMAFNPAAVTVKVGQTVTWRFADQRPHTATGDGDAHDLINSPIYREGTYRVRFDRAGVYHFHCTPHPMMTGTVTVE